MNLMEEIRSNSGVEDVEYLSEGIFFFKNSSKIKRLAKNIQKKREKMLNKGDIASAKALKPLYDKATEVANTFEELEQKYLVTFNSKDVSKIKSKYAEAEREFRQLIKIANKDTTKKALAVAGGITAVIALLLAGSFGLESLRDTGVLKGVSDNLKARGANFQNARVPDGRVTDTGMKGVDELLGKGLKGAATFANDQTIKNTNKDLMKFAGVAGGTGAGILTTGLIQKLKSRGRKNRMIADTAIALESLKGYDDKPESKEK